MADGSRPEPVAPSPKHPGGRPPFYRPEFCAQIIALGMEGFSQAQMAASIGVSKQTITDWAKSHPQFSDALTLARTYSQSWWESEAQTGLKNRDFNASIWDRSVKSRFREDYQDKSIDVNINVNFDEMLRKRLTRAIAAEPNADQS